MPPSPPPPPQITDGSKESPCQETSRKEQTELDKI